MIFLTLIPFLNVRYPLQLIDQYFLHPMWISREEFELYWMILLSFLSIFLFSTPLKPIVLSWNWSCLPKIDWSKNTLKHWFSQWVNMSASKTSGSFHSTHEMIYEIKAHRKSKRVYHRLFVSYLGLTHFSIKQMLCD